MKEKESERMKERVRESERGGVKGEKCGRMKMNRSKPVYERMSE